MKQKKNYEKIIFKKTQNYYIKIISVKKLIK